MNKQENPAPLEEQEAQAAAEAAEAPQEEAKEEAKEETVETFSVTREQMEKMENLAQQLSELNDQHLRLMAEYDNYRKRTAKEKETIYQDAKTDTVGKFLEVYDNLERAVTQAGDEDNVHKQGMVMIFNQLRNVLEKMGVTINFTKVYQEYAGSGLCMIPLEDAPHYPISLIYRKSVTLTEAQRTFLRFLRKWKKSTSAVSEGRTG